MRKKTTSKIPKKHKRLEATAKIIPEIAGVTAETTGVVDDTVKALGARSIPLSIKSIIPTDALKTAAKAFSFTGAALGYFLYLFNLINFGRTENKNIEKVTNFALDTIKVGFMTLGLVAKVVFAPVIVPTILAVVAGMIVLDVTRNVAKLAYNAFKTITAPDYKSRKLYWNRTKEALLGAAIGGVAALVSAIGAAVVGAAAPIAYIAAGISAIALGVTIFPKVKSLYTIIKNKLSPAKNKPHQSNTTVNAAVKPTFGMQNIHFGNMVNFKLNGLDFHSTAVFTHLQTHLGNFQRPKLNKNEIEVNQVGKVDIVNIKALQSQKPNAFQKLKGYGDFVVTKDQDHVSLQKNIVTVCAKITSELLVSQKLKSHSQSEKRFQKICALEDLQFILLQLNEIRKIKNNNAAQLIFLHYRGAKNLSDTNSGSALTLSFKDFHANKDKIWNQIELHFKTNYPKFENSFFKETGEVKSLFNSVEAWMKQKNVDELHTDIAKLCSAYGVEKDTWKFDSSGKFNKEKYREYNTEEKEKVDALNYANKFLLNIETISKQPNEVITLSAEGMPKTYYNPITCLVMSERPTDKLNEVKSVMYDLRNQEDKDRFLKLWWSDAEAKYSEGLGKSIHSLGRVAEIFDDVRGWVAMQDFSHLIERYAPKMTADQVGEQLQSIKQDPILILNEKSSAPLKARTKNAASVTKGNLNLYTDNQSKKEIPVNAEQSFRKNN